MERKFVKIDGIKVSYLEGGNGDTVLFLHGWGIDSDTYSPLLDLVANRYHVIALDFPGFGKSDMPLEVWGISEFKQFVVHFMAALSQYHFKVVAHSFGARVAIKLGAENAEQISKMVFTGAAGIKPKKTLKRRVFNMLAGFGKKVFSLPLLSFLQPKAQKLLYTIARESDYVKAKGIMKPVMSKVIEEDLTSYLKDVRSNVLLVWGRKDTFTPLCDGELMFEKMPFAKLKVYDNVGHRLPYESADDFAKDIAQFLE